MCITQDKFFFVVIGTFCEAAKEGIHLCQFDTQSAALRPIGSVSGIENPSFLQYYSANNRLYAVSETQSGSVAAFHVDFATGEMNEINRQPLYGDDPCHLVCDVDDNSEFHTGPRYPLSVNGKPGFLGCDNSIRGGRHRSNRTQPSWLDP